MIIFIKILKNYFRCIYGLIYFYERFIIILFLYKFSLKPPIYFQIFLNNNKVNLPPKRIKDLIPS